MAEPTRNVMTRSIWRDLARWDPRPIPFPRLDPGVLNYDCLSRAAEILRYRLLQLEYTLSPTGVLREWIKLNLRILFLLLIPACLLVPGLVLITTGLADIAAELLRMLVNVLKALLILAAVAVVGSVLLAWFAGSRK